MELHRVCAAVYVCCAVLCCAVCVCGWSHLHLHAPVLYVCVEEEGGKGGGFQGYACVCKQASPRKCKCKCKRRIVGGKKKQRE